MTYIGYSVSVFCIPLFHTLYFPLYEKCKLHFKEKNGWHENSFSLYAVSAGISGLFCNIVTNPFWVVRTRMQGEIFRSACNEHYKRMYKGIFHSLLKIGREVSKIFSNIIEGGCKSLILRFDRISTWHKPRPDIFPFIRALEDVFQKKVRIRFT